MTEEKIIIGTEYPLEGLITIPETGTAPYPAVVLVHGSGASDMDSKVYKVRPFKDIAHGLAKHGIATIRYNKRSWTHGKALVKNIGPALTVKEETIEDAIHAADLLRADHRINSNRIFIAGLSMGGALAPRIDAEGGDFAGLIIMAGSSRRFEEIIIGQQEDFMKTAKGLTKWIVGKQIAKLAPKLTNIYDLTDEEAKAKKFIGNTTVYYLKDFGQKTVAEYLSASTKPIFVMQPEKDLQATVERDFKKYQEILADRDNATLKLYPGLNHTFMPALYSKITDATKEFKKERHVEDDVIKDIAEWVKSHG